MENCHEKKRQCNKLCPCRDFGTGLPLYSRLPCCTLSLSKGGLLRCKCHSTLQEMCKIVCPFCSSLWAPIAAETVVLWTARPTRCQHGGENCCEEFSSELMTVESDGKLSRRGLVLHRRYFPFTIRMPGNSREAGFVAWTNSTSSRRG